MSVLRLENVKKAFEGGPELPCGASAWRWRRAK